eukprot:2868267-Amphidinium_carterae.1
MLIPTSSLSNVFSFLTRYINVRLIPGGVCSDGYCRPLGSSSMPLLAHMSDTVQRFMQFFKAKRRKLRTIWVQTLHITFLVEH